MLLITFCLFCLILVSTVISDTPAGTLCGFQPSYDSATICAGSAPWESCPQGYTRDVRFGYIGTESYYASRQTVGICYKTQSSSTNGLRGTICGLKFGNLNVPCNGHLVDASCPTGYSVFDVSTVFKYCQKMDPNVADVSGTVCGMRTFNDCNYGTNMCDTHEVACDGYFPGLGACPIGYNLLQGERPTSDPAGSSRTKLSICVKI